MRTMMRSIVMHTTRALWKRERQRERGQRGQSLDRRPRKEAQTAPAGFARPKFPIKLCRSEVLARCKFPRFPHHTRPGKTLEPPEPREDLPFPRAHRSGQTHHSKCRRQGYGHSRESLRVLGMSDP
jgi:hypothetical protein